MVELLAMYRRMIRAHGVDAIDDTVEGAVVIDDVVSEWLAYAVERHDATMFGSAAIYKRAMVFFAAHIVELMPGTGVSEADPGAANAGATETYVTKRKDDTVEESYALVSGGSSSSSSTTSALSTTDANLARTSYGQNYLSIRNTRTPRLMGVVW